MSMERVTVYYMREIDPDRDEWVVMCQVHVPDPAYKYDEYIVAGPASYDMTLLDLKRILHKAREGQA